MPCLVDDEHGELLRLGEEAANLVADGAVGRGPGALLGEAEFASDGLVHVEDVAGGQRDVAVAAQAGMQSGGDVPADGGFAGADGDLVCDRGPRRQQTPRIAFP